jgi:hypothetical protein
VEPTTTVAEPVLEVPTGTSKGPAMRTEAPTNTVPPVGGPQVDKTSDVPAIDPTASTSPPKTVPVPPAGLQPAHVGTP